MKELFTEVNQLQSNELYYIKDNLEFGLVYKVTRLDIEEAGGDGEASCYQALENFFYSVPEGVVTKVHLKSSLSFTSNLDCKRKQMLEDGHRNIEIYISFNHKQSFLNGFRNIFKSKDYIERSLARTIKRLSFTSLKDAGSSVTNIDPRLSPFFNKSLDIKVSEDHLLIDNQFKSILKLESLSAGDQNNEVYFSTLATILKNMPLEYELTTVFKKLNRSVSEADLRVQTNKNQVPSNIGEYEKLKAKEEVLKQVELHGQSISFIDCVIILQDYKLDNLNEISDEILGSLGHLGGFKRQLKTNLNPYLTSRIGYKTSSMQRERGPVIPFFLPLTHYSSKVEQISENSIAFLREDLSPYIFDPSNPDYYARNGVVIGKTGMGKSVFLNVLINSLISSQNNYVILVDVKTSHTALVEEHGGIIHEIDIESSTGMSAFNLLDSNQLGVKPDKYVIQHITDFIISLAEGSDKLKDKEKSKISNEINLYINDLKRSHSLNDFISYIKDKSMPNYENLKRWGKNGIYSSVFAGNHFEDNRLQYFDLKSIESAGKPHITKAIISSVMTKIYLLLRMKKDSDKIFVIFDETPFFIKDSFTSLAALSKNMRSMNGSTFFASQITDDLIGPNGEETLFSQSSIRVLFSIDSQPSEYIRRTQISESNYSYLKNKPKPIGKQRRNFVLSDDLGERVVSTRLTDVEYARATTNPNDKEMIAGIRKIFDTSELVAREIMRYGNEVC